MGKEGKKVEKDLKIQALQEMEGHPAWKLYQDHLDRLCRIKEVEKSKALRSDNPFEANKAQFEIDGIQLASKGITALLSGLQTE